MRKSINVAGAPAAVGPYVHAVRADKMLFLSGQLGLIPETGQLAEGIEAQTRQSLENLKTVLLGAGSDLDHVVKTVIFLADINDFAAVNEIYAQYFNGELPARSCVQAGALPKGGLVEIEVIAVVKE
ncbi:MAG: RidA family protein [Eubacterium sp.]|nr:RidA family protein [Eubacterium sp.]